MNLTERTTKMKTWLDGLTSRQMMDKLRKRFPDGVLYMEAGTVNADLFEDKADLKEIGIQLARLTACEINSKFYDLENNGKDYYAGIFVIGHKIKTLREAGYAV